MIKKKIYEDLKQHLLASSKDKLYNFLLNEGTVRGVIIQGTHMIQEMKANHELGILETLVLGHVYLAAALMSANLKGNDRMSIQIDCSGPVKGLLVESNAFGEVRGYLKRIPIPIEKPLDDFNLSPFFKAGLLTVTRLLESGKNPFTGTVELAYGSVAKDMAYYFYKSEQIPTAFHLSIQFDKEGNVIGAGGLFLQVMPGASDETAEELENLVQQLPSLGSAFSLQEDPVNIIEKNFFNHSPVFIDNRRIEFMCHCSENSIRTMLTLLPESDLRDIRDNGPFPLEIRCHHCNTSYHFNQSDIQHIYKTRFSKN